MRPRGLIPSLVALAACCVASHAHADIVVVVNARNPLSALTREQVTALYFGVANSWPDGSAVEIADQRAHELRAKFYDKVTQRSIGKMKATWARIVFTGKGAPPREFQSSDEVKAFVASNPHAIGYLRAGEVDSSVKVVLAVN